MNSQIAADSPRTPWICCQVGAREHYAIPRALAAAGHEVKLLTDVWASPSANLWMPERWKQRKHPEISSDRVVSWNLDALRIRAYASVRRLSFWERVLLEDQWFQRRAAKWLHRHVPHMVQPPVVFAYSYAAREIFETAKELGCMTVLGQIDPGPVEMRLVQSLETKYGFTDCEWPHESYWNGWRQECRLADRVVVNSDWSREALIKEGMNSALIDVIPLAYEKPGDTSQSQVKTPSDFSRTRPLRVLFLGQINLRKGIKELAEAIKLLYSEPVEWTFVGSGNAQLVSELQTLPQAVVVGAIARNDVARFYQKADIFILPTHSDGFAITQLEAASYGLPVIASPYCGKVVIDGKNGLLLPEVSEVAIAAAVKRLLEKPEILTEMRSAQEKVSRLSIRQLGERLTSLNTTQQPKAPNHA